METPRLLMGGEENKQPCKVLNTKTMGKFLALYQPYAFFEQKVYTREGTQHN